MSKMFIQIVKALLSTKSEKEEADSQGDIPCDKMSDHPAHYYQFSGLTRCWGMKDGKYDERTD